MIMAWRIPMLTAQMLEATLEAAERQRQTTAGGAPEHNDVLERYLVRSLERLGYRVILERTAA
jgi:hypothetical protein